jgi:alpha-mannosidase
VQRKGSEFFEDLAKEADSFETWRGELYFELHRGTYTTQARTKWHNRKAEVSLRDAEILSVGAMLSGAGYPSDEFARAWKLVLKNQFHDVIPGSSVNQVYKDADSDFRLAIGSAVEILGEASRQIAGNIDTSGRGDALVVFNTLSWARDGLAEVRLPEVAVYSVLDTEGNPVSSQIVENGQVIRFAAHVPAMGYATYRLVKGRVEDSAAEPGPTVAPDLLENRFFRIKIDENGLITSIFDKRAGREVVPEGAKANLLQLFDDKPLGWDAWDVDFFYEENGRYLTGANSIEVDELGPLYGSLRIVRSFGESRIEQKVTIYRDIPRIDFQSEVEWRAKRKMLKVAFPVTVNSPTARYEIQFGNVERPTHSSTSWDFAKFEVCGHKWADLSEGNYGVSLLNDCKYGHDTKENVMRLTLLRSPIDPDPDADQGRHFFTYSIFPHEGDYASAGTVRAGYELNIPLRTVVTDSHGGSLPARSSAFAVDAANVVIDTVKKAQDDDSIILRLYESQNRRGKVSISTEILIKEAWECDLMENNLRKLDVSEGVISLEMGPFEIKTVRIISDL